MDDYHVIIEKIKRITGSNRLKREELEKLDFFLDNFTEDKNVDLWLKENWERSKAPSQNISSKDRVNIKINKSRFAEGSFVRQLTAAIVIATLCLSTWLYLQLPHKNNNKIVQVIKKNESHINSIVLKKGKQSFDLSQKNLNIQSNHIKMIGSKNKLKLEVRHAEKEEKEEKQIWNTLKIPKGKDYYVILSDGTQVWMNACSELKFPDHFQEGKREVSLIGEAYFIVQSDTANPFFVTTQASKIMVTGTKFNVCSYHDENRSYVTLLEGKVGVHVDGQLHQIKPGEQLTQDNKGKIQINQVDPLVYISWKDGLFEFNDMPLNDIALRLTKWFDVSFEFESKKVASQRFTGMVKKEQQIDYFLKILEKTTDLNFIYTDSKVIIKEK